ncbi:MAG: hypothetical protein FJX52_15415 [Alphaproteobacteria bacterium]|nr:hypothetical protein [Alphaproteobacteria bacterium]
MTGYLAKPFRVDDLSAILARHGRPRPDAVKEESSRPEPLVVDTAHLDETITLLGRDEAERIRRDLRLKAPSWLETLQREAAAANWLAAAKTAHALISDAAPLGLYKLVAACRAIETACAADDVAAASTRIQAMPAIIDQSLARLAKIVVERRLVADD